MRRGLLLIDSSHDPFYFSSYGSDPMVFADDRLLAQAGDPVIEPFKLKPVPLPAATLARRPQTVALDLIGILQTLDNLGGIQLTLDGRPRANELRKLVKAMGWKDETVNVDGFAFPNPSVAWIDSLQLAGLLVVQGGWLVLAEPISAFATRPYADQVRPILGGMVRAGDWDERGQNLDYSQRSRSLPEARQALLMGLAALPTEAAGFFAVDDLDQCLYERIGEHFSLGYRGYPPYSYNKTPEQQKQELAAWRQKLREEWLKRERLWLNHALTTWVYTLGLVELAVEGTTPVALRLTDLGRALLHPHLAEPVDATPAEAQTAWVVQPNFEIVVYLDRATPQQLAFLERHAERIQAQQHVAQYRLTREAVYAALESGSTLEKLLTTLETTSGRPLPQNVAVDLREWAALREQMTIYRRARLLEFPDSAARDAVAPSLAGTPVGDRFLLVTAGQAAHLPETVKKVDYSQPLARCLSANEDGLVTVILQPDDLLLSAQLDRWAERLESGQWRLSQASVAAAVARGLPLVELLKLLAERLIGPLPPLLEVALRAWAGEQSRVAVAGVTVLQCSQPAVFAAIVTSPKLRRYLRGEVAPDLVVVDQAKVAAFEEQLRWAGLQVSGELSVKVRKG